MSTGILGCVWGLGNVITIKEPTFLKFELTAESFKRFKGGGAPQGHPGAPRGAPGRPAGHILCVVKYWTELL